VYVQGKKWMWKFAYPGGPNSTDVLRVPAGRPVRLLLTSRDVIHSFYVPALRMKAGRAAGRYNADLVQRRRARTVPIFCAEYCGLGTRRCWRAGGHAAEEWDVWMESAAEG